MRTTFGKMILAPAILAAAALASQSASAESFAKVPFSFSAAGKVWPAGQYSIQKSSSGAAVTVTNRETSLAFTTLLGAGDAAPYDTNITMRFDEINGGHALRSVQYKYEITDVDVKVLPVKNYSSSISVKDNGGKSTVEWKGAFYRGYMNNDPPPELNDEAAIKAVTGVYRTGLDALKQKLEAGG